MYTVARCVFFWPVICRGWRSGPLSRGVRANRGSSIAVPRAGCRTHQRETKCRLRTAFAARKREHSATVRVAHTHRLEVHAPRARRHAARSVTWAPWRSSATTFNVASRAGTFLEPAVAGSEEAQAAMTTAASGIRAAFVGVVLIGSPQLRDPASRGKEHGGPDPDPSWPSCRIYAATDRKEAGARRRLRQRAHDPHLLEQITCFVHLRHIPQHVARVHVDRAGGYGVEQVIGRDGFVGAVEQKAH
jgi:membrane-bound lytic murein transglycosylase